MQGPGKSTLADRAKYQFEADSEDDEMENEIDSNLDALHGAAKRLNALGRAMGEEVCLGFTSRSMWFYTWAPCHANEPLAN